MLVSNMATDNYEHEKNKSGRPLSITLLECYLILGVAVLLFLELFL
jgi:hypothetical protein